MDLRQLEYVVAVADAGSFRGGADELRVAQPSVSQAIRSLENELGVELFVRTAAGAHPTAAGRVLLDSARRILRDAATATASVAAVRGLEHGRLDLVCLPTLAVAPTSTLIGELRRAHPGVSIRLAQPESPSDLADSVRSGRSELGLTELTELTAGAAGLVEHVLGTQDFLLLVPAGSTIPQRVTTARLAELPVITSPPGTSTRRQLDEALAAAGAEAHIAVETDHREAILALVAAGAGVALLPRSVRADPPPGTEFREMSPRIRRRIGIIRRATDPSPAAAAFLTLAGVGDTPRHRRPAARRRP